VAQTHQAASGKRWALFGNRAAGNVGEETVYTKHQNLPQTSKHYEQSSLRASVLVIVGVPFGVLKKDRRETEIERERETFITELGEGRKRQ